MPITTLVILIIFNLYVWSIILLRLLAFAHNTNREIAFSFALGMLFQGIHSIILPFSGIFQPFISGRVLNSVEMIGATISAYFLLRSASAFHRYAVALEGITGSSTSISRASARLIRIGTIGVIIVTFLVLSFDFWLAGDISNTLTPSAVNINHNSLLVTSRILSGAYITYIDILIAYIVLGLLRTEYSHRNTVRIRAIAAIACVVFHSTHFASNLVTTLIVYSFGANSPLGSTFSAFYSVYDTIILFPLAISFLIVVGPKRLVEGVDRIAENVWLWYCYRRITWLRNFLLPHIPAIALPMPLTPQLLTRDAAHSLSYATIRYTIECSDAIYALLCSLTPSEYQQVISVAAPNQRSGQEIEAILIMEALKKDGISRPESAIRIVDYSELASFQSTSLHELQVNYMRLSKILRNYPPPKRTDGSNLPIIQDISAKGMINSPNNSIASIAPSIDEEIIPVEEEKLDLSRYKTSWRIVFTITIIMFILLRLSIQRHRDKTGRKID